MRYIKDCYHIEYKGEKAGSYSIFEDGGALLELFITDDERYKEELAALGFTQKNETQEKPRGFFFEMINEKNRVKERRRPIYISGDFRLERVPIKVEKEFLVYKRDAKKGSSAYSPLPHDAPHYEGSKTPDGMREWANFYKFELLDDGTYRAALDEAWDGGSYYSGGTINTDIPEEAFELSYDEFLAGVVKLAAAEHYGFTAEQLFQKKGLKEFFGYK